MYILYILVPSIDKKINNKSQIVLKLIAINPT